ncbi:elongation of fatty acids protein 2 [Pycnococcus provasolii]|uniref:Flap endonuclease 1 n=1 Tax=Pycnococcus provasolii TaxID=41880 RepID=A0A830HK50_9CHLO|nr:elongation of fatty acids protein 2 [Pycnococcus provasolii]|eukprot:CAMPEP_0205953896 /NCGR_PEP_ID=MMETSP1459-20131121/20901_1 /ASSEMBLY_ACC=CAM_ASM_001120 /TAXON_ID=41880 /ORGANISM="Pycnococcus provasolii, Strain RCC931" /LENGTH=393 /DNA_ID=CAMNT_0053326049 /DNA_START=1 /DNA_END=1182 /DNA_ORIENTATION=+
MGIKGLTRLLGDNAPRALREQKFESYFGRTVAIDASMHIYQSMVVVGRSGDAMLTDADGQVTSHLLGMFYRTLRMLEAGIKPIYVFEGKPPSMKKGELAARREKREEANAELAKAKEEGNAELVEKFAKRTVKVTTEHNEECKRLLRLLGVPVVQAPGEAEATCVSLCKMGKAFAVATEDMDSLTFGAPKLVRNLMTPASSKLPIHEYEYEKILSELELTPDQFIDVCILCGCDYLDQIRGIGPVRALELIRKHGSLEKLLTTLDPAKYPVPENWDYEQARKLFKEPEVVTAETCPEFKWTPADTEGVMQFLVTEKNFNADRVKGALEKLAKNRSKGNQGRLESFFGATKVVSSTFKRKEPEPKGKGKGKAKAGAGAGAGANKKGKFGGFSKR